MTFASSNFGIFRGLVVGELADMSVEVVSAFFVIGQFEGIESSILSPAKQRWDEFGNLFEISTCCVHLRTHMLLIKYADKEFVMNFPTVQQL